MELLLGETNVRKEERKQDKYNRYYIDVYYFLGGSEDIWDELEEGYHLTGYGNQIYRIKNGKLVFVHDGAEYDSKKIEYSVVFTDDIKVTMEGERYGKKHTYFMHFYNVPEETIYKKFMMTLCERISYEIYHYTHYFHKDMTNYGNKLKKLNRMELELYKNCIFANRGYSFQDSKWLDFMKEYYRDLNSYSMIETLERLWGYDGQLLELIQKELADQYFVIGDYYKTKDFVRLMNRPSLSGNLLTTISKNEWVNILDEGETETIDGVTSAWVKVKLLNKKEGWCFGGYLGY
jgi:hypothetical protein